ncbi:MFS transporter [Pelagibius litoralis]|uniref:MFS transporter n=1 Tax=Pelagibius litoralis TaxID=374515 RepID=A0A967F2P4_9PROT|nr:MFS transporter [Pelagibius litoralis]NIA71914.1 MFS transporter [Pelagibius litoralis]
MTETTAGPAAARFSGAQSRHLACLMLGIAVVGAQALMVAPMLTDMARDLGVGPAVIGRAHGVYGAGVALAALAAAPRLDLWPRRATLIAAMAALALALLTASFAGNWWVLAAAMGACGLAAGIILPSVYALAGDLSPPALRARAVGRVITGWSLALVLGVPLAAFLSELFGWRGVFAIMAGLAALSAFTFLILPGRSEALSAASVSYRQAITQPGVVRLLLVTLAYMIAFYGTYTFLSDHLRGLHDAGAGLGGLIALSYGLGFGAAVAFDGLLDRLGPWRLAAPVFVLIAGIYLVQPWAAAAGPLAIVLLAAPWGVLNHFGLNIIVSLLSGGPEATCGAVMGLYSGVTYIAHFIAGAVMGLVYADFGFTVLALVAGGWLVLAAGMMMGRSPSSQPSPRTYPG